jgi:hypothetical protein
LKNKIARLVDLQRCSSCFLYLSDETHLAEFLFHFSRFRIFCFVERMQQKRGGQTKRSYLTWLSDTMAPAEYQVTILGTNFSTTPSENIVRFNGTQADVVICSAQSITALVPIGATTGPVTVTVKGVTATGPVLTTYFPGVISEVSPICGPAGTQVTIKGSGFETTTNYLQVWFGVGADAKKGALVSASPTEIKATVPDGLKYGHNADVHVKIIDLKPVEIPMTIANVDPGAVQPNAFAYAPFILTDFSPKSGAVGSTVTVTGTGFAGVPADFIVTFNISPTTFTEAQITDVTSTTITAKVPVGAVTGKIFVGRPGQVTGAFPGAYFRSAFTVTP